MNSSKTTEVGFTTSFQSKHDNTIQVIHLFDQTSQF